MIQQRFLFRILLPIIFLALSITLAMIGEAQRDQIIQSVLAKSGHLFEPIPEGLATARYVDYAMNAGAWVASMKMPFIFRVEVNWWIFQSEKDWWYLLFVVLTWFLVGFGIDNYVQPRTSNSQLHYIFALLLGGYGAFVSYAAIEFKEPPWENARWFILAMFLWGGILTAACVYVLSRVRPVVAWILGLASTVFLFYGNIKFYQPPYFPFYLWRWFMILVFVWGSGMLAGSTWLLFRRRRQISTV